MENNDKSMAIDAATGNAQMTVEDVLQKQEIGQLKMGLLNLCKDDLDRVKSCLKEVLTKQDKLDADLDRLNQEHSAESRNDCQRMFSDVKEYTDRLHLIKKQMTSIHQRVKQLKKRTITLKSFVARESSTIRQRQLNEESLIAKATTSTPNK